MDLEKCLNYYTDGEVIDFLTKRRLNNLIPNIKAQLLLSQSMLQIALQLKEYPIDEDNFFRGREESFVDFIKSYVLELNAKLERIDEMNK